MAKTSRRTKSEQKTATRRPTARRRASVKDMPSQDRHTMIAEAAYYKAEQRGFGTGFEVQDWLEAEREIDKVLGRVVVHQP